jgi:hypothetical protein
MELQQNRRSRRSSSEIKELLELFSQSGMSVKAFCMLQNISEAGFYKWRLRYGAKPAVKENNFVRLQEVPALKSEPLLFAEVKGIRLYQAVEASYLKELMA